jgi:anti-sigma regulatory factor (Ser/Thr protein kinase)
MSVDAPAQARAFVRLCGDRLLGSRLNDALLMTSELATNAVRYGVAPLSLSVTTTPTTFTVGVYDAGAPLAAAHLRPQVPGIHGVHGRGLPIVSALSARWGATTAEDRAGKTIWFELPVTHSG